MSRAQIVLLSAPEADAESVELGHFPPGAGVQTLEERIDQQHRGRLVVPRGAPILDAIPGANRVAWIQAANGLVYERLISERDVKLGGSVVTFGLEPISNLLGNTGPLYTRSTGGLTLYNVSGSGLLSETLDNVWVPWLQTERGYSYIQRGAISPDIEYPYSGQRRSFLAWLQQMRSDTGLEWQLRRSGSSAYVLDIDEELGSSSVVIIFGVGRNVTGATYTNHVDDLVTSLLVRGLTPDGADEPLGIEFNAWKIASINSGGANRIGFNSPAPLSEDDQWVGHYVQIGTTTWEITDSFLATREFELDNVTGLAVGDWVQIVLDTDGTLVTEIPSPSGLAENLEVVRDIDRPSMRGERNFIKGPDFPTWTTLPGAQIAYKDGTQAASAFAALDFDGLPADFVIPDGSVLLPQNPDESQAWVSTNGDATANGSGEVTVALDANPAFALNDNVRFVFLLKSPPDDHTVQEDAAGPHHTVVMHRDPTETGEVDGAVDGGHTNEQAILLKGLPSTQLVQFGDRIRFGASTDRMVMNRAQASGGGVLVHVGENTTVSDDDDVDLIRPSFAGADHVGTNVIALAADQGYVQTPSFVVRAVDGLSALWYSVGLSYWSPRASFSDPEGMPRVRLWDVGGASSLNTTTADGEEIDENDIMHRRISGSYELGSDKTLALRIWGIRRNSGDPRPDPVTFVRWVMVHLGTDGAVPFIDGSWANEMLLDGLSVLAGRKSWPEQISLTIAELAHYWDVPTPVAEAKVQLGATARYFDPVNGRDEEHRIEALQINIDDPTQTRVFFGRRQTIEERSRQISLGDPGVAS